MKSMYVCGVWMRLRVYMSVQAMHGAGNALYWNDSERQNSMHLTLLKHQNTKTSLYKLSKNHWVIALFEFFGSVRKKLQFTVSLKHPVNNPIFFGPNSVFHQNLSKSTLLSLSPELA